MYRTVPPERASTGTPTRKAPDRILFYGNVVFFPDRERLCPRLRLQGSPGQAITKWPTGL